MSSNPDHQSVRHAADNPKSTGASTLCQRPGGLHEARELPLVPGQLGLGERLVECGKVVLQDLLVPGVDRQDRVSQSHGGLPVRLGQGLRKRLFGVGWRNVDGVLMEPLPAGAGRRLMQER